jgi:hypothetical protein
MAEPRRREDDLRPGDPARQGANVEDPNLRNTTSFRGDPRMPPERVRDERPEAVRPDEGANLNREPMAVRTADIVEDERQSQWFGRPELEEYRSRWSSIQTAFVDAPRQAVKDADDLIQSLVRKLSDSFTHERERLTKQWDRGEQVSTEDLRVTLQRYRTYFDRLLNV